LGRIRGNGGGLLRNLYAQGLHEAADLLQEPRLHDVATQTERLAREWEALAAEPPVAERVHTLYENETATRETLLTLLL